MTNFPKHGKRIYLVILKFISKMLKLINCKKKKEKIERYLGKTQVISKMCSDA